MEKIMRRFMFTVQVRALVLVCLFVCGGRVMAQNAPVSFRTAAGCGPAETQFSTKAGTDPGTMVPPSAGKALVYVIEVRSGDATGVTTRVGLDGKWVGGSSGKAYLAFEVDPGDHHVCVDWQSSVEERQRRGGAVAFRAEDGRSYYFVANVIQGNGEDLVVSQVDDAEGLWLLSKATKSVWKETKGVSVP
jgi:hypothetical protein